MSIKAYMDRGGLIKHSLFTTLTGIRLLAS